MKFVKQTWTNLSAIGQNRIIKSSFVWIFFVPIAAKTITTLKDFSVRHPEIIWVKVIADNLTLPFQWTVFYASALCFAVGILIYNYWCPNIIRDFKNFAEFKACENGEDALISRYSTWLRKGGKIYGHNDIEVSQDEAIRQFIMGTCINDDSILRNIGNNPAWEVIGGARLKPNLELNAWYYLMVKQMCRDKHVARVFVMVFFFIGFVLLAWVLLQNFIYVATAAFPNYFS